MNGSEKSAATIELEAARWIERREFGGWSQRDEAELDAWLGQSLSHRVAYDRLDLGWQKAGRLTVLRQGQLRPVEKATAPTVRPMLPYWRMEAAWARTERLTALRPQPAPHSRTFAFFRVAAAAVTVLAIAAGAWFAIPRETGVTYATSIGGHESIMLADGSRIELNTDSAIRLADSAHARNIWLEKGEAYLQVTHDASRPLTVFAGNRRIVDLGTKFVVKREAGQLEVAVLEGRVSLDAGDASGAKATVLKQGETAIASADGVSVRRKTTRELSDELGWRRGVIVFDNTPLGEAAEQVSRYNAVKVAVRDAAIARLPVTGTVSSTDPKEFLRMARVVFGLRAEKIDGKYVISH